MPQPIPKFEDLTQLRFITNAALLGCNPPFYALVEFSQEPALDLFLLFFGFSVEDFVQGMLDPRKGRNRKPARHGRKRPLRPGLPDISEGLGGWFNEKFRIGEAVRLSPLRYVFGPLNFFEGIAMTAAVVEGVTDVGFHAYWGHIVLNKNDCHGMAMMARSFTGYQLSGGIGPVVDPIGLDTLLVQKGFQSDVFGGRADQGKAVVGFKATVRGDTGTGTIEATGALEMVPSGSIVTGGGFRGEVGEVGTLYASTTVSEGEYFLWGNTDRKGWVGVMSATVLAFATEGWFGSGW